MLKRQFVGMIVAVFLAVSVTACGSKEREELQQKVVLHQKPNKIIVLDPFKKILRKDRLWVAQINFTQALYFFLRQNW